MTTPTPTIGRQVHYCMNAECGIFTAARRMLAIQAHNQGMPIQLGNDTIIGDYYPATITRVNDDGTINLVIQLDGPDTIWAANVVEGDQPGQWTWPPRV